MSTSIWSVSAERACRQQRAERCADQTTVISALAVRRGEADALICGLEGRFTKHMRDIRQVIGVCDTARDLSAMSLLINSRGRDVPVRHVRDGRSDGRGNL
jgi:phosphotransacetylase